MFVDELDRGDCRDDPRAARHAVDREMRAVQLRALGGAMARVPDDATAFAHRARKIMVNVGALFDASDDRPQHEAWVDETATAASRRRRPAAYVNFLGDEGQERVRAGLPGRHVGPPARDQGAYDPTNLFRLNQNVPPADE